MIVIINTSSAVYRVESMAIHNNCLFGASIAFLICHPNPMGSLGVWKFTNDVPFMETNPT